MKNLYYILISLWIVAEFPCICYAQITIGQTDPNGISSSDFNNLYTFRIPVDESTNTNKILEFDSGNPKRAYLTFWDFGDGTFYFETRDSTTPSNSIGTEEIKNSDYVHCYPPGGNYTCTTQVLKIYDFEEIEDDDRGLPQGPVNFVNFISLMHTEVIPSTSPGRQNHDCNITNMKIIDTTIDMEGNHIKLTHGFRPAYNYPMIIVLTYNNCIENTTDKNIQVKGNIIFNYEPEFFHFGKVKTNNGEKVDPDPNNTPGQISINYDMEILPSNDNTQRNIFIELHTKSEDETSFVVQKSALFTSKITTTSITDVIDNNCNTELESCSDENSFSEKIGTSHDPNIKTATLIKDNGKLFIEYYTRFQNTGNRPADRIIIQEFIPNELKASTIKNVQYDSQLDTINTTYDYDSTTRLRTWKFIMADQNNKLRGLREPGFGYSFGIPETEAWLTYRIEVEPDSIKYPCQTILSQSHIFFDEEDPITTNTAIANFDCNNEIENEACCIVKRNTRPLSCLQVEDATVVPLKFPKHTLGDISSSEWYPSTLLDLNDPCEPSITSIQQNPYPDLNHRILQVPNLYFTYSDSCTRWIIDYPIYVNNN